MRNRKKVIILRKKKKQNQNHPKPNPTAAINILFLISFHFPVVPLQSLLFVVCRELLVWMSESARGHNIH